MVPVKMHLAVLLLAALVLTGCGSSGPLERDRFYALTATVPASTGARRSNAVLQVETLRARGMIGGRQILYRTREQPLEVARYDTLLWAEPLPESLAFELARAVRASGLFRQVLPPGARAQSDYVLSGTIEQFEHRPTDQPPAVTATIDLVLVRSSDHRSLWSRTLQASLPLDDPSPDGMAAGFDRLASRLIGDALTALQRRMPATGHP